MNIPKKVTLICTLILLLFKLGMAADKTASESKKVAEMYPNLVSGVLTFARLTELPSGLLLRSDGVEISASDIDAIINRQPIYLQQQLQKNAFFILEQEATGKILFRLAKKSLQQSEKKIDIENERQAIQFYIENLAEKVVVTDDEAKQFYQDNKDMFGGSAFEQVKEPLKQYLLQQKQQEVIDKHIRTLGKRINIEVSASWVKKYAALAKDNPVDQALYSGKPSLVDFGSVGCVPCDMMAPILDTLKEKYEGKLNVLFIHVREEPILASRYGVQTIPVQIFFDRTGKEVFRHTGFFPQEQIESKLSQMGVK